MHDSLISAPTSYMLLAAAGLGAAGLVAIARDAAPPAHPAVTPTPAIVETPAVHETLAVREPAIASSPSDLHLVFRGGGRTYMQLDMMGDAASLRSARPSMTRSADNEAMYTAIATVDPADAPASARSWLGKRVIVDGTCEATIDGFALVARLEGDTGYAGVEAGEWTAQLVFDQAPAVLSARLSACTGSLARDAALPPIVALDEVSDRTTSRLATSALRRVLAMEEAADVQRQWEQARPDAEMPRRWYEGETDTDVRVMRHPTTGTRWIAVHVSRQEGCGGINANLFGLFRVAEGGTLETVELRDLGTLHSIDQIFDLEGDGTLELAGRDWLGLQRLVTRANGEELATTSIPFYGCAC